MLPPTGNCFSGWRPYGCGKGAFILRLENAAGLAVASAHGQQSPQCARSIRHEII